MRSCLGLPFDNQMQRSRASLEFDGERGRSPAAVLRKTGIRLSPHGRPVMEIDLLVKVAGILLADAGTFQVRADHNQCVSRPDGKTCS